MSEDGYGIQPTGYIRKPLGVVLSEIEAEMVTEFGVGVIQTAVSPFGQLNALMADIITEADERNHELYQSYDPSESEGNRLDSLGKIRLINRSLETDNEIRKAITNEGESRVDIQDLSRAIRNLSGVTYAKVFVNETGEVTNYGLERGTIAVAVMGGSDNEIAETMRRYVAPGVNAYGNVYATSNIDGYCRTASIIRPVVIPVKLIVEIKTSLDKFDCPSPSPTAIENAIASEWSERVLNGLDPSFYSIRSIVESLFSNVEVISIIGERDGLVGAPNQPVLIGFIEIAEITKENIVVNIT